MENNNFATNQGGSPPSHDRQPPKSRLSEVFRIGIQNTPLEMQLLKTLKNAGLLSRNDIEDINFEREIKGNEAAANLLLDKFDNSPQEGLYPKFWQCVEQSALSGDTMETDYQEGFTGSAYQGEQALPQRSNSPDRHHPPDTDNTVPDNTKEADNLQDFTESSSQGEEDLGAPNSSDSPKLRHQLSTDNEVEFDFTKSLRKYQKDLAEPALRGDNTVIVSPTGSGKTHVAAYIIDEHLKKLEEEGKTGNVVFIVPTVTLADQQKDRLIELIGFRKSYISKVTGRDLDAGVSLLSKMEQSRACITVMTPQILINGLRESDPKDRIEMGDISMIVLDECHKTQRGHPYYTLMKYYLDQKNRKEGVDTRVPQVVGMTASFGTGRSNSPSDALNYIYETCASLDAKIIQPVTFDEDLQKYLNIPKDIGPIIVQPRQVDPFTSALEEVMKTIEEKIAHELRGHSYIGNVKVTPIYPRSSPSYTTWIRSLTEKCIRNRNIISGYDYQNLLACLDTLEFYHRALLIHRDVRAEDALKYLKDEVEEMNIRKADCIKELTALYRGSEGELERAKHRTEKNPILEKIKERLVATFKRKPDSKALLMTSTIEYTKALTAWIEEDRELKALGLVPGRVTGVRDPSMSKMERNTVLDDFRNQKCNILVSTNVLQEGIDFPACNLVIRHIYVPNETGHTQVKGRGRAKGSESLLVALSVSGNRRGLEEENKMREEWAKQVLEQIQRIPPTEVRRKIIDIQTSRAKENYQKEQEANTTYFYDEYILLCSRCPQIVCSTDDIVCIPGPKYVVTASNFTDECQITWWDKPLDIKSNEIHMGKIHCKRCQCKWGSWATVDGKNLPLLKIKKLSVQSITTKQSITCTSWGEARKLFKIRDVEEVEIGFDISESPKLPDNPKQ